MPLMPGSRLGPYEIIALLGAGGMGEVYRANDPRLQRQVAVKVLSVAVANDSTIRQRFEIEARAASGINHPNIVRVYDFGNQDGTLYIVWELVEGKPLSDEPMNLDKALRLGAQIADGIAAAHEAAIVHRDLKPDNIFVARTGDVLVGDFGLARPLGESSLASPSLAITASGVVVGTPQYMAPEQGRGEPVGPAADIYALGCTLYFLLTGSHPYQTFTIFELLRRHCEEPFPDVRAAVPAVPPRLAAALACAVEKDPARRWPTAGRFAAELEAILADWDRAASDSAPGSAVPAAGRGFSADPSASSSGSALRGLTESPALAWLPEPLRAPALMAAILAAAAAGLLAVIWAMRLNR
jgi:serine/threonine protein kinase